MTSFDLWSLPPLNASLNAICTVLLLCGYALIRRGRVRLHRLCMISAFVLSLFFLVIYVYFHVHAGVVRFGGQGWIRPVYFTLLLSHTILAAAIVPLVLITLTRALKNQVAKHKAIARWTLPIWLYVSITGVVIYWLLYRVYTPVKSPSSVEIPAPSPHTLVIPTTEQTDFRALLFPLRGNRA